MNSEIVAVGLTWFAVSAFLSTYSNTQFLKDFDSPYLLTLVRFFGSAAIGFGANFVDKSQEQLTRRDFPKLWVNFTVPALMLLAANYANSISLSLSGITLTYVVKSSIPVVTVLINAVQGTIFQVPVYLTLVPTVLGVMLAAWSDMDFSILGFMAAVMSMIFQTLLNVSSKLAIQETKVSGVKAQFIMVSICAAVLSVPGLYGIVSDLLTSSGQEKWTVLSDNSKLTIMFFAALSYHLEYVFNFVFTAKVSTLAFSIADIARRLTIIAVGSILFDKPLSTTNKLGIFICFCGVLSYSLMDKKTKKTLDF